ncbi:MAG: hypothetical protein ABI838_03585 [Chloroflexota bacterium]
MRPPPDPRADPRLEEEPEPIIVPEPDEDPDEPDVEPAAAAGAAIVPRVDSGADREYEYRVDVITVAQVLDGTLADRLSEASHEEWSLVDIIDAGDQKAILLRKRKQKESSRRPVGFAR